MSVAGARNTPNGTIGGSKLAGTLQKLVLPTGGAIEWDFQLYNFPADSDDKPFLTRLARAMELRGFVVETAESVEEAVAKAKGVDPNEIIVCVLDRPRHEKLIAELRTELDHGRASANHASGNYFHQQHRMSGR